MSRYLLDTNHAGTLLKDDAPLWPKLRPMSQGEFHFCRPSLGELWYMVFNSTRIDENRRQLEKLLSQYPVLEYDSDSAIEFGKLQVELRKKGRPIPAIDVQIAAIAHTHDLTVLTSDAHFAVVDQLGVENWLA